MNRFCSNWPPLYTQRFTYFTVLLLSTFARGADHPTLTLSTTASEESSIDTSSSGVNYSSSTVEVSSSSLRVIHAVHLTASAAGSKRYRQLRLEKMLSQTMINAVVVDIKEEDGWVYVPGVMMATNAGAFQNAIPDLSSWLTELRARGIYSVARIVVFKDNILPRKRPSLGVHTVNGELWSDRKKTTWLDPYNREAWRYPLLIAQHAARAGFDEVQFDYIRFPTDGNLKSMHFSRPYSRTEASQALVEFLRQARKLLHPLGTKISIDVFGLTTTVSSGMGIGQQMGPMAAQVDFVCPMTYPSHYNKGEYGIPIPNNAPYRTIHMAMHDALKVLGPSQAAKLRPYFQDFSLKGRGIRYGPNEVRAQIQAAADLGVMNWTLWNASCHYTLSALVAPVHSAPTPLSAPQIHSSSSVISSTVTAPK